MGSFFATRQRYRQVSNRAEPSDREPIPQQTRSARIGQIPTSEAKTASAFGGMDYSARKGRAFPSDRPFAGPLRSEDGPPFALAGAERDRPERPSVRRRGGWEMAAERLERLRFYRKCPVNIPKKVFYA